LDTKDRGFSVKSWVTKARTPFHDESGRKMFTLEVVQQLLQRDAGTVNFWLGRLANVELDDIGSILSAFPDGHVSPTTAAFATRVLEENKRRMEALR